MTPTSVTPTSVTKAYEDAARTTNHHTRTPNAHQNTQGHLTKAILAPHEDAQNTLSPHMASFVDVGTNHRAPAYERIAEGRTAGTRHRVDASARTIQDSYAPLVGAGPNNQMREPITRFSFAPLPLLNAQEDMLYHKKGAP
jgi:hypothetical protein